MNEPRSLIIERDDGGVSILTTYVGQEHDAAEIEKWGSANPGHRAIRWAVAGADAIPQERTFRNAWCFDGKRIQLDIGKVREIHRIRLRAARAPILTKLDTEYMRADERGGAKRKQEIAAEKQVLRDITQDRRLEAAQTPDEVKAYWPDILESAGN